MATPAEEMERLRRFASMLPRLQGQNRRPQNNNWATQPFTPQASPLPQENDWDKFLRPATRVINAVTAGGYGVVGALDKAVEREMEAGAPRTQAEAFARSLQSIPNAIGDFAGSFGDAWAGRDENLRHGHQLIERATDLIGTRTNRDYVDTKDNVNPWVKGVGGFGIDVLADPITYLPFGVIGSGLKGALRAGVGAARVKQGGDLAKTAAFFGNALNTSPTGAVRAGFSAAQARQALNKAQKVERRENRAARRDMRAQMTPEVRRAQRDQRRGRATPAQETLVARFVAELPATKAADEVVGPAARVVAEMADAGLTPAARGAESVVPDVTSNVLERMARESTEAATDQANIVDRQRRILTEEMARLSAPPPPTRIQINQSIRGLEYTVPKYNSAQRKTLEAAKPYPTASRKAEEVFGPDDLGKTRTTGPFRNLASRQAAWMTRMTKAVGPEAAARLAKISDGETFAKEIAALVATPTTKRMPENASVKAFERAIATDRRTFDDKQLKKFAELLGFSKKDYGGAESITDFLRRQNLTGIVTRFDHEAKARRTFFEQARVLGAKEIEEGGKAMGKGDARAAATRTFTGTAAEVGDEAGAIYMRALTDAGEGVFGRATTVGGKKNPAEFRDNKGRRMVSNTGTTGAGAAPVYTRIWESKKAMSVHSSLIRSGSALATKRGLTGEARELFMDEFVTKGVRFTEDYLKSIGVTPMVMRASGEKAIFKGLGGSKNEVAFLGLADVLDQIPAELRRAVLYTGKDRALPVDILHDMGRWALRLNADNSLTDAERIGVIVDAANKLILAKARGIKKSGTASPGFLKFANTRTGQESLQAVAGVLGNATTRRALFDRHVANGIHNRAMLGEKSIEMSGKISQELMTSLGFYGSTTGNTVESVIKALREFQNVAKRNADDPDAVAAAKWDLELVMANRIPSGDMKNVRNALRMADATRVGANGAKLSDEAVDAAKDAATAAAGGRTGKNGAKTTPKSMPNTKARKQAAETAVKGANKARREEVEVIQPEVDEILEELSKALGQSDDLTMTLDAARAELTNGLPAWMRGIAHMGQKLDGRFGMRNIRNLEVSAAINTRVLIAEHRQALNTLAEKFTPEQQLAAWNAYRRAPGNELTDDILQGLDEGSAAAIREIWPVMSLTFDHSGQSWLARMGVDSDYLNTFLARVGTPEAYRLPKNAQSYEVADAWKAWEFDADFTPFNALDKYFTALQQASVAPGIAAAFSAQFGHRSTLFGKALTDAEAVAEGWVKLKPQKGDKSALSQFVDTDQYYPKEMLTQLSMLDEYLATSRLLDGDSIFDRVFRQVDPIVNSIKASITLWRPGHHATNLTGETIFNLLAGVTNPARYSDAMRILATHGYVDKKGIDAVGKLLQDAAPEGYKLREMDSGMGIFANLGDGGKLYSEDSIWRLLDDAGVIVHHNVAEDLVTEAAEAATRRAFAQPLQDVMTPRWLGQIAASRDNLFRIAHAVDILTKRQFKNLDEAKAVLAKEIHEYHPTMQVLSAFEQKYMRRFFYFYTWQKQAMMKVFEAMVEVPGRVMVAPKALYNVSAAAGGEPQSFGQPVPNDPRIPSYLAGQITAFTFPGGIQGIDGAGGEQGPFGDDGNFVWSLAMNAPQLDILNIVFGSSKINPDMTLGENAFAQGQALYKQGWSTLSPAFRIPAELATGNRVGGGRIDPSAEGWGQYLVDQTGFRSASVLSGLRADQEDERLDVGQARKDATLVNWLTGIRLQNLTSPDNIERAQRERLEELRRMVEASQQ